MIAKNICSIYRSKRRENLLSKGYSDVYINRGCSNKFFNLPKSIRKYLSIGDKIEKEGIYYTISKIK